MPLKTSAMRLFFFFFLILSAFEVAAQRTLDPDFSVIGFYTGKNDLAHISFVHEANKWFSEAGKTFHFSYDSTNDWTKLRPEVLAKYDIVVFLDTRPDSALQRKAFEEYMKKGGAWLGFHFSAFALTPSAYPQNWPWYHEEFLGTGQYKSNTWRPTSAVLRVEDKKHPVTESIPQKFRSSANEWYCWEHDLSKNKDIRILASIDSSSFPLGTGPKKHEIWQSGYYPVVWTNTKYKMVYMNMGHNDMDYEGGTNKSLSSSFESSEQNKMIIQTLKWLASGKKKSK